MFKLLYIFPSATPICHGGDLQQHGVCVCECVSSPSGCCDRYNYIKQKYCVAPLHELACGFVKLQHVAGKMGSDSVIVSLCLLVRKISYDPVNGF